MKLLRWLGLFLFVWGSPVSVKLIPVKVSAHVIID